MAEEKEIKNEEVKKKTTRKTTKSAKSENEIENKPTTQRKKSTSNSTKEESSEKTTRKRKPKEEKIIGSGRVEEILDRVAAEVKIEEEQATKKRGRKPKTETGLEEKAKEQKEPTKRTRKPRKTTTTTTATSKKEKKEVVENKVEENKVEEKENEIIPEKIEDKSNKIGKRLKEETPAEEVARLEKKAEKLIQESKGKNVKDDKTKEEKINQEIEAIQEKAIRVIHGKKEIDNDVASTIIDEEDDEEEEIENNASKKLKLNIDDIKKTIKEKKKIPPEEMKKINKSLIGNIIMAIVMITYFLFLNLGKLNMRNDIFLTDLKIFSVCILLIAIVLLEAAYRKEKGNLAIYGVEMIVASLLTVALIYVNIMFSAEFLAITAAISFISAIYYILKTIITYFRKRKQFYMKDIEKIVKEEE